MPNEENAIVLDYLPQGRSAGFKSEPFAIVLGTAFFTLLEVVPKTDVTLRILESVYVGAGERTQIALVKKRIEFNELTSTAKGELEKAIEKIVIENPDRFIQFLNRSSPISLKRHRLELLPGLGKKHFLEVLNARDQKPFGSFEEFKERLPQLPNPVSMIVKRVVEELEGEAENHYLFTRPPAGAEDPRSRLGYRR